MTRRDRDLLPALRALTEGDPQQARLVLDRVEASDRMTDEQWFATYQSDPNQPGFGLPLRREAA